jgi:exopolysaccharide biosynthesis polyprenyl glycosylphosphotransferase
VFSRHHRKVRVLFGLSDVLLTALAFEAAYQTRLHLQLERVFFIVVPTKALLLGVTVLVWVALGLWLEVYDKLDAGHPRVIIRDSLRQCALGAVAVILFEFLLRLDLSRTFLALFAVYSWGFLCLFRLAAGKLVGIIRREFGAPLFVLVVGLGERARRLGDSLERSEKYGVRLTGFLADEGGPSPDHVQLSRSYPVYPLTELPLLLQRRVIDEVLFAVDSRRLAELEEVFLECDEEGVRTRVAVDFFPHVNSRVHLEELGSAPLLTFTAVPHDEIRLLLKRMVDVTVSFAGLLVLSPLMVIVAALIRLTSAGPAVFRQVRCGLNGRRFVLYKFRSMCENAEDLKSSLEHLSHRRTAFKIPNDPRLTLIGRWLRKFSIDEWPQLWNVLRGDMSLVGPRPAVPEEVEQYKRWQRRRLRMRPGLTCLWTLAGRDALDFETWMKMDMEYIDNWSLALDWRILLQTIPRVLTGKGAH